MASDPGSVVLDPFGGSGTTYVTAELLGRRWVGVELNCAEAVARLQNPAEDRSYLKKLSLDKNVLFKREVLRLRERNGHRTDRYRVERPEPAESQPKLFALE